MKRNIHSYPTKISWEHYYICQKKHTEGLKTYKKLLENLENNLITFWRYGKLELNWEALTEFKENGEPNFFDSFIKHDAKFHWISGKKFDNQKVQRLMKFQEKSKESESSVTYSSQTKKKFASLFCAIYSEDNFCYNLHAARSLHATQTDINTDNNLELTTKWKEMAAKVGNSSLLNLLAQGILRQMKSTTTIIATTTWFEIVRSLKQMNQ